MPPTSQFIRSLEDESRRRIDSGDSFNRLTRGSRYDDIDPFEVLGQLVNGFIGGFTTFHVGDEADNTVEAIANSIGQLLGFIGYIPGVGSIGKIGAIGVGKTFSLAAKAFKAERATQILGRPLARNTAARLLKAAKPATLATAKFRSVPFLVSDPIVNRISRAASKTAFAKANKVIGVGTLGADILEGSARLGLASAVSSHQEGIDAMMGAFLHGAAFGGTFRAIGNIAPNVGGQRPQLGNLFSDAVSDANRARFLARTFSGAVFQGLPSTLADQPVELQVYEYLLGAYFGGHEMGKNQRAALEIIGETHNKMGRLIANRMLADPKRNLDGRRGTASFNRLDPGVQEELLLHATNELARNASNNVNSLLQAMGMRMATDVEESVAVVLGNAYRREATRIAKEQGLTGMDLAQAMLREYGHGSFMGVRLAKDGGVDLLLESSGKHLTSKNATKEELAAAETRLNKRLEVIKETVEKTPGKANSRLVQDEVSDIVNALNAIKDARGETGEAKPEQASIDGGADAALSDAKPVEPMVEFAERPIGTITTPGELLADVAAVQETYLEHNIPVSAETSISDIASDIANKRPKTSEELASSRARLKIEIEIAEMFGEAVEAFERGGIDEFDAFKGFVGKLGRRFGYALDLKSEVGRKIRRSWVNGTGRVLQRQLVRLENGNIEDRPDIDLGKRTDRTTKSSFLSDIINSIYERFGVDTELNNESVLEKTHIKKNRRVVDADLFDDPNVTGGEIFAVLSDRGADNSRFILSGEKDKGRLRVFSTFIRDLDTAQEVVTKFAKSLQSVYENNKSAWIRAYGDSPPNEVLDNSFKNANEKLKKFWSSSDGSPTQAYLLDMANRIVLIEQVLGGGKLSFAEMVEANITGKGKFAVDPVEFNKRVPIFSSAEPRFSGRALEDIEDVTDGTLKAVLVNGVPKSNPTMTEGVPMPKRNLADNESSKEIRKDVPHDAQVDGHIKMRADIYDKYTEFFGWPDGTNAQKGYIFHQDKKYGSLLVKPKITRMSDSMSEAMREKGIHMVLVDNATKQYGTRTKYDLTLGKDGSYRFRSEKTGRPIKKIGIFDVAAESLTNNPSSGSDPKKEFRNQKFVSQGHKSLSYFRGGSDAIDAYERFISEKLGGDFEATSKFIEAEKELDNPKLARELSEIDLEDVSIYEIIRIMKGSETGGSVAYDTIARKIFKIASENQDLLVESADHADAARIVANIDSGRSMAWQIINSGVKLTPFLLENNLAAKPLWDTVFTNYVTRRVNSPRVPHSAQLIAREYDHEMMAKFPKFSRGQFYLDNDAGEHFQVKFGDKTMSLKKAWDTFVKAGGYKSAPPWMRDAMEFLSIRVPQDSISGGRVIKFMGFTGERGTSAMFHPDDMFYMGGMDIDIDKAFLYQDLPREIVENYRSNQRMFERRFEDGDAFISTTPYADDFADTAGSSDRSHPVNTVDFMTLFDIAKSAKTGNDLLGISLNSANRAKVFQEILAKAGKKSYTVSLADKRSIPIVEALAESVRGIDKGDTVLLVYKPKDDKGKRIDFSKSTVVNVSADAAKYEGFKIDRADVPAYMRNAITDSLLYVLVDKGDGKGLRRISLSADERKLVSRTSKSIKKMPRQMAAMQRLDAAMHGRNPFTRESLSLNEMIEILSRDLADLPDDVPSSLYRSGKALISGLSEELIGNIARRESMRPGPGVPGRFVGARHEQLKKDFDKVMKTPFGYRIARFAARRKIRLPESKAIRDLEKRVAKVQSIIQYYAERELSAQNSNLPAEAKKFSLERKKHERRLKRMLSSDANLMDELPAQDLYDQVFTVMLYKEGMAALGLSPAKLSKMSSGAVAKELRPLEEIAKEIRRIENEYNKFIVGTREEEGAGTAVKGQRKIGLSVVRVAINDFMNSIEPEYRAWAELFTMSSLKPQETSLEKYPAYAEAQKELKLAKKAAGVDSDSKKTPSEAQVTRLDLAKERVRVAKQEWYDTNFTRFWANTGAVSPETVRAVYDAYNTLAGATFKEGPLTPKEEKFVLKHEFGGSKALDELEPGVTEINLSSKIPDEVDSVLTRMRILEKGAISEDQETRDLTRRLEILLKSNPALLRDFPVNFFGLTKDFRAEKIGSSLAGVTKPELREFLDYAEGIANYRGAEIHEDLLKKGDPRKFKWYHYFYNPDKIADLHLNFDAKMIRGEAPVVTGDGKIVMTEVNSYISTFGMLHKVATRMTDLASRAINVENQEFSRRFDWLESAGKDRDLLISIAVASRESDIGTVYHKNEWRKARRELAKLERSGIRYLITGRGDNPDTSLTPKEYIDRFNLEFSEYIGDFYRRWIGAPGGERGDRNPDGLTKNDLKNILWEDETTRRPALSKTMRKLANQTLRGNKPATLSLNAIYRLTHRYMMDNLEIELPPLNVREYNTLADFLIKRGETARLASESVPPEKGKNYFDYSILMSDTFNAWRNGELRLPEGLNALFEKANQGSRRILIKDIADPAERRAYEESIIEQLSPALRRRMSFSPVGFFTPERYWPRNGWPNHIKKAIKRAKMEELAEQGANQSTITYQSMVIEAKLGSDSTNTGGFNDAMFRLFFLDKISIKELTEIGGLEYRPGHVLTRDKEALPGYDRGLSAIQRYVSQIIKHNFDITMSLMNSMLVRDFENPKSGEPAAGKYTKSWTRFMKMYNRANLGYPTIFPKSWLSDPHLKIDASPYYVFTDEFWASVAKKIGLRFGFKGEYTDGEKRYVSHKLAQFSKLEGKYELLTLLARTKTGFANIFGGSENTWVWNGTRNMRNARSIRFLRNTIDRSFETRRDVRQWVAGHGAIESFLSGDFEFSPVFDLRADAKFIGEVKELFKKHPYANLWDKVLGLGEKHGISNKVMQAGAYFMRQSEQLLRTDAWIASYLAARETLKLGDASVSADHPWLLEMAGRGVTASQFLYNNANRPLFATSSFGKIYSRFQIWAWKSVKFRREVYAEAKNHRYNPQTEEFKRLQRIMTADLLIVALAKMFPFSMFESSMPPPASWIVEFSEWAFGDDEKKKTAFFGVGPTKIITPPVGRVLEDVFRLMVNDDWDRFIDYHIYTYFPFGPLFRDVKKTVQSPITAPERLTGFPLTQVHQSVVGDRKRPHNKPLTPYYPIGR